MRRHISKISSTALSLTSSCLSRRSTKKWTRPRKCCSVASTEHFIAGDEAQLQQVGMRRFLQLQIRPVLQQCLSLRLTYLTCVSMKPFYDSDTHLLHLLIQERDSKEMQEAGGYPFNLLICRSQAAVKCCGTHAVRSRHSTAV